MTPDRWPALPIAAWRDTFATLHLWFQVVGKLMLTTTPFANHFWNITFHLTSRGLATQLMEVGDGRTLVAAFDFVAHELVMIASDGHEERVKLDPKTVAQFHAEVMAALARMGIAIRIWTTPIACEERIPFEQDTKHRAYDAQSVGTFWRALDSMRPVFEAFRGGFVGKASPLQFFWDAPDLAMTRYSGRPATVRAGAGKVERECHSHESIGHGFRPGGGQGDAHFYASAWPEPEGFGLAAVLPGAARYDAQRREFILPYESVRSSANPDATLMRFLESTYGAGADLGGWNRRELER